MKMTFRVALVAALLAGACSPALAQNTPNYVERGGARTVVGGSLDVVSGGDLDIESGGALKIAGTAVTASAAELNTVDVTTAGTVQASKAVVVDANKHIDTLGIAASGLKIGVSGSETTVTASGTELNYVDITAAGTVDASKAIVVDANKAIDTLSITAGGLKIGASGSATAVTASGAELNYVDITAAGTVDASKAIVVDANKAIDTLSITAGGLKIGASGSATAVTSTGAELNYVDVTTTGTVEASKAVVVDANKDASEFRNLGLAGALTFGAGGTIDADSGADTASSSAVTISKMAGKITSDALTTAAGAAETITLTNTTIAAGDMVFVSVANGTNSAGVPVVGRVTPGSGSVTIEIRNVHAADALNGTLVVSFIVVKA